MAALGNRYLITDADLKTGYKAETTYGVDLGGTPPYTWIGPRQGFDPSYDRGLIKVPAGGSRDLAHIIKGLGKYGVGLDYIYVDKTFLALALANPPTAFTLAANLMRPSGTAYSLHHLGSIINQVTVSSAVEGPVKVRTDIICKDVNASFGAAIAAAGASTPKVFYDTVVKLNTYAQDAVTDWSFSINNNLQRFPIITSEAGGDLLKYLAERQRDLKGDLTIAYTGNDFADILTDAIEQTILIDIGSDHFTFSGAKFDTLRLSSKVPAEIASQKISWTAKTLTVT